jgi:uncharacterized protein YbjT (DUF2867 family)
MTGPGWGSLKKKLQILSNYQLEKIMLKTCLVTGATSSISLEVIRQLRESGIHVRAVIRNPEKAEPLVRMGVDIVIADLDIPETLPDAFKGVERAFILTAPSERAPAQFSNALWAARQADVKHVVRLSAFGAGYDAPTINGRYHALSDNELQASGLSWTIIRPHFFMQNLSVIAEGVRNEDKIFFALADGKMGMIDTADIALFVAKVLAEDGHSGKIYTITGPESLSMSDFAKVLSQHLGRKIAYYPISVEDVINGLQSAGVDQYSRDVLHDYLVEYSRNWGDVATDDFKKVTGKEPSSTSDFVKRNISLFS